MQSRWFPLCFAALAMALCAAPGAARADDATGTEGPYIDLATSRTKAELAVRRLQPLMDDNQSGWRIAAGSMDLAQNRMNDLLGGARETEARKPEDDRNNTLIDDCNQRQVAMSRNWEALSLTMAKLEAQHRKLQAAMQHVLAMMDNLAVVDQNWKESGCDPVALKAAYDAVTKHAAELYDADQAVIAQVQQHQKEWDANLEDIQKTYGKK